MENRIWDVKGNEARIIVTNDCNYRCIFCHNEGFDASKIESWKPSEEVVLNIIEKVLAKGCKDITFTGGEPLIYREILVSAVEFIGSRYADVSITIITNGSLLTEEWLKRVNKFKNIRFNVSLHTANADKYAKITNQKSFSLEKIKEKLNLLKKEEIPFKLNCVALIETMTIEDIKELIDFSEAVGAQALKIIELLIMENQTDMFESFIAQTSISKRLPKEFKLFNSNSRRDEYFSPNKVVLVELQKCRCRFGCEQCLTVNTTCLNAKGEFFPCFEFSDKCYSIADSSLDGALSEGMKLIETLADKYGTDSPSLIKDVKYVASWKELFFIVSKEASLGHITKGYNLVQKREYSDSYFSSSTDKPGRVIQIREHKGDRENAKLIISFSSYIEEEYFYTKRKFQHRNKVPMQNTPEFIEDTLNHLDWNIDYSVNTLENEYANDKNKFQLLSIGDVTLIRIVETEDFDSILINSLLQDRNLTILTENIDDYYKSIGFKL